MLLCFVFFWGGVGGVKNFLCVFLDFWWVFFPFWFTCFVNIWYKYTKDVFQSPSFYQAKVVCIKKNKVVQKQTVPWSVPHPAY